MSSDSDELMCTPPEIIEKAKTAIENLLPAKSRDRYETVYHKFMERKLKNKVNSLSENVMLVYFEELSTTMKPSSLWAIYSMLRATINIKHDKINIATYPKLIALLKRKADGFKSKKSKTLTSKNINDFLQNAPDTQYLFMKVVLIIAEAKTVQIVYSLEQETCFVMSYYRNWTFVNGEFVYSVTNCKQEYLAKYRDLIIQETSLEAHIRGVINRFVRAGSVDKAKSPGKPSASEEVVDVLRRLEQKPQTSFSLEFLLQHEIAQWIQSIDQRVLQNIFEIKCVGMCHEQNGGLTAIKSKTERRHISVTYFNCTIIYWNPV
ncbi:hypothetical protein Zmor_001033 [Zophobas morio]|uniref:Uncharacterized protein n=1 Tax=Zophobas morio TaxID=2755281 RepID=A0AA38MS53_9CUCU|nr:hypothetical protein Zmor_001033 [Zophobas morio]